MVWALLVGPMSAITRVFKWGRGKQKKSEPERRQREKDPTWLWRWKGATSQGMQAVSKGKKMDSPLELPEENSALMIIQPTETCVRLWTSKNLCCLSCWVCTICYKRRRYRSRNGNRRLRLPTSSSHHPEMQML